MDEGMARRVTVAAGQLAPKSLDPVRNVEKICEMILDAGQSQASLIVFPELSDSGYLKWPSRREDLVEIEKIHSVAAPIPSDRTARLGEAAREADIIVVAGLLEAHPSTRGRLFNAAVMIDSSGEVIGHQRKVTAPLNEFFYYARSDVIEVHESPLGRIGMSICYDNLFPETMRIQAVKGMDISCMLFNHCPENRQDDLIFGWQRSLIRSVVVTRAAENTVPTIYSNRTGLDDFSGLHFKGGSLICDAYGEIIAEAGEDEGVLLAELDLSITAKIRGLRPVLKDRRPEIYGPLSEGP